MNKNLLRINTLILILGMVMLTLPAIADENVEVLKNQIEELKAKVAALEERQDKPISYSQSHTVNQANDWDPMAEMHRIHGQMERMFQQAFDQGANMHQGMFSNQMFFDDSIIEDQKDGYLIKLNAAGFDRDKIDIKAQDGSLTISGEYKSQEKRESEGGVMESHQIGRLLNSVSLPEDADVSKMKIEKKQNMLEVFIPRKK